MERTIKLEDLQRAKDRLAALPSYTIDVDRWLREQALAIHHMSDGELLVEWNKALKRKLDEEKEKKRDELVLGKYVERRCACQAHIGELTRELQKNPPAILREAIERMEREISARQLLGTRQVMFGNIPGGQPLLSTKNRTKKHIEATVRAEKALEKLKALVLFDGDLEIAIRAIFDEMHAADMDADFTPEPVADEPEPVVAAPRGIRKGSFEAVIE